MGVKYSSRVDGIPVSVDGIPARAVLIRPLMNIINYAHNADEISCQAKYLEYKWKCRVTVTNENSFFGCAS